MRALIVDEPWISSILSGRKTWEIRGANCRFRERIGLIRKGSGLVVGTAEIVDVHGPLSLNELRDNTDKHGASLAALDRLSYKTPYAWEIARPRTLPTPLPYDHPNGAVIWVTIPEIPEGDAS